MKWTLVTMLLYGLATVPAMAEIYRWVDEQGRVHFGDRPRGTGAESVDLPRDTPPKSPGRSGTENASSPAESDRLQRWLKAKQDERVDRRETQRKKRNRKSRRLNDCKQARSAWDYYAKGGVFYDDRPDGTRHFLNDTEVAEERRQVQRAVKRLCGTDPTAGAKPKDQR